MTLNAPEKHPTEPRLALVVAVLSMVAPFSVDTYLPSFPDIQREFGVSGAAMQQSLSLYLLAFAAGMLIYGPLSDSFGRRRVVLSGLALYIVASAGSALASDFDALLLMRVAQGLSASAGLVVGRAVVRDVFDGARAQRVMSRIMLLFSVAPAVAPVIGGFLDAVAGWRSVFWFLAGLGVMALWLAWRILPETLPVEHRHSIHPLKVGKVYGRAFANGGFMVLVVAFAFAFAGMFLYIVGAPDVVFRHLGWGRDDFVFLFLPLVSGVVVGSWLSGRVAERWGAVRSVNAGLTVMAGAALVNAAQFQVWLPAPFWVVAPVSIYAMGMALALPALVVLALDYFPHNRGTAAAVQGFTQTLGNALVAGLAVPLVGASSGTMASGELTFALTALVMWLGWRRFARKTAP